MIVCGKTNRRGRRGGFSLMLVMIAMLIAAMGVTAMALIFQTDARRTRAALVTPQLRQMLLAGEAAAQDELRQHGTAPRDVKLVTPVENGTVTLHIEANAGGEAARVEVVAEMKGMRGEQRLQLAREADGAWSVMTARLVRMPIQ